MNKIGPKLILKIKEFLKTGRIQDASRLRVRTTVQRARKANLRDSPLVDVLKSPRYTTLKELTKLHGLGAFLCAASATSEILRPLSNRRQESQRAVRLISFHSNDRSTQSSRAWKVGQNASMARRPPAQVGLSVGFGVL